MNLNDFDKLLDDMHRCLENSQRLINSKKIERFKDAENMSAAVVEMQSLLFKLKRTRPDLCANARSQRIALLMNLCKDLEGNLKEKRNDLHAVSLRGGSIWRGEGQDQRGTPDLDA